MAAYDSRTALVVTDVQNDFADPEGSLYVVGGEQVVPFINQQIEQARQAGALVVYTQDWHPPATPHFAKDGGIWPVHCVAGSWGASFVSSLVVRGPVVQKGSGGEDGYSGFSVRDPRGGHERDTRLEALLREHRVPRVVIVGIAADYCIKETAIDAARRGFEAVVLRPGTRAVNLQPEDEQRAFEVMKVAGVAVE